MSIMSINSQLAGFALFSLAAGGVAYALLYPLISGQARAAKRQKALITPATDRRDRLAAVSRRDQVAQSLKEIEAKKKATSSLTIEVRIQQAGLTWSKRQFIVISAVIGLVLGLAFLVITQNVFAAGGALFVGALGVPRWLLSRLRKRRVNKFVLELPNAVDVIVRGIRSGLPLGDCIRIVASEAQEPLRSEFRAIMEAQAVGMTIGDAMSKLYERVPIPETNFFAIVISIQQKAGGNLSEALGNLSKVLRERRKMSDKIKAMSAEAKASAGIIGALPPLVALLTYLSSPDYISLLWTTTSGKFALVGAALWMSCGIFTMKRMISFKF